jgi:hypothetical protein
MGYNEETLDEANVWWHSNQTNQFILLVSGHPFRCQGKPEGGRYGERE